MFESKTFVDPPNMAQAMHVVQTVFKTLTGASFIVQVAPGDSVMTAKTKAASKLGWAATCTKVIWEGKRLDDDDDFYNMKPHTVNCVYILEVKPDTTETTNSEASSTDKHTELDVRPVG